MFDDELIEEELRFCPTCNEENAPIGRLGAVLHFCCRYCGIWYNERIHVNEVSK